MRETTLIMFAIQFFARAAGCLDPRCPFLHDKGASVRAREKVLEKRRARLAKPTMRDIGARERDAIRNYHSTQNQVVPYVSPLADDEDDDEDIEPEIQRIFEESAKIRKICNNPSCLAVKMKKGTTGADIKMKQCSGCAVATYCSVSDVWGALRVLLTVYEYSGSARSLTGRDTRKSRVAPLRTLYKMTSCGIFGVLGKGQVVSRLWANRPDERVFVIKL